MAARKPTQLPARRRAANPAPRRSPVKPRQIIDDQQRGASGSRVAQDRERSGHFKLYTTPVRAEGILGV
jgi:hypothetical protein